jgi:type II secretion system protein C
VQPSRAVQQLLGRGVALALGAIVIVLALSFGDANWYEQLASWLRSPSQTTASRSPAAKPGPVGPPIVVTPMRPLGTDSSVSPTALPLILTRTQLGRNSREGFAQIGVNARTPQTYAAGALLANGARLTEIYEHYVVLERDGHSVRLYLQGEPQPVTQAQAGLTSVGGKPPAPEAQVTSHDPLTRYIRPSPVFVGSQLHGYALYAGQQPTAFTKLGLQAGDVLTTINGALVSSAEDSLDALQTLTEGAVLTVVVERQGVSQSLSLDGSILAQPIVKEKYSVQDSKSPAAIL